MTGKDWRDSREYRLWKVAVVRRDRRCAVCGSIRDREAHHKDHASYFPDRRFVPENGIVLCGKCHSQYHNNYHAGTRAKCTCADFGNFMDLVGYLKGLEDGNAAAAGEPAGVGTDPA